MIGSLVEGCLGLGERRERNEGGQVQPKHK